MKLHIRDFKSLCSVLSNDPYHPYSSSTSVKLAPQLSVLTEFSRALKTTIPQLRETN